MGRRKDKELCWVDTVEVPCAHIADYYESQWKQGPNLHNKLLWNGYRQWARGYIEFGFNNLYGPTLRFKSQYKLLNL